MNFIREHKKLSILILIIAVIILLFGTTFARYIYNIVHNHILESNEFYFNSTVLAMNGKQYKINNWDGVNNYVLTIDVNNKKNALKSTTNDITYNIEVSCPDTVICTPSKKDGIVYKNSGSDSYQITVIPKKEFHEGDEIEVTTKAKSTFPYEKELSATYTIGIETNKFSYNIEDKVGDKYFTLNLTNTATFYEVEKAFSNYEVGDRLTPEEYFALTEKEKDNCFSAKVTISFKPDKIYLDMTNKDYLHRIPNSENTENINNYSYINGFSFKMDSSSSEKIMFYKKNPRENYTYPIVNQNSIITVTVKTAD